jgi:hypothetical protein
MRTWTHFKAVPVRPFALIAASVSALRIALDSAVSKAAGESIEKEPKWQEKELIP